MFKCTHAFLLLVLAATAQGADLCCADIQSSQADLKSDVKAVQDVVQDLRTRLGEQFEWPSPSPTVQPSRPTPQQKKVAFFVGLSKHLGPVNQDTGVIFDNIVTNFGSAYSVSTGRFTAPVKATYQFSVTISAKQTKKAAVTLLKNGAWVMHVWAESNPNWATSSNVAILSLEVGDQIWLQLLSRASDVYGEMYTTFSGFLIFEN